MILTLSSKDYLISHQFGEEVMDKLYDKVKDILVEDSKQGNLSSTRGVSIVLELKKKIQPQVMYDLGNVEEHNVGKESN